MSDFCSHLIVLPGINLSVSSHMSPFSLHKNQPLFRQHCQKTVALPTLFGFFNTFVRGVCFSFLANPFAAASISFNFSPGILFNFSSDPQESEFP